MSRKYGLALEKLTQREIALVLKFLNEEIAPKELFSRVLQFFKKQGKKTRPCSIEVDLPGFAERSETLRKVWKQYVRGARFLRDDYDPAVNYWAVWISFRPLRIAAPTPGDWLALSLTRAVANGQINRFICCRLRACRKFWYMKRARSDMRFHKKRCRMEYHYQMRK